MHVIFAKFFPSVFFFSFYCLFALSCLFTSYSCSRFCSFSSTLPLVYIIIYWGFSIVHIYISAFLKCRKKFALLFLHFTSKMPHIKFCPVQGRLGYRSRGSGFSNQLQTDQKFICDSFGVDLYNFTVFNRNKNVYLFPSSIAALEKIINFEKKIKNVVFNFPNTTLMPLHSQLQLLRYMKKYLLRKYQFCC